MKAMIFAAGLGTRLRPLTDSMPKALVPIGGKALLERQLIKLREAGITDVVINIHHFPQQVVDFCREHDNFGMNIAYSDESAMLLETGGGLKKAAPLLDDGTDEPVLVCNVDILSNISIPALLAAHSPYSLATIVVSPRDTQRYFLFDENMRLSGWTNVATGDIRPAGLAVEGLQRLAFAGMHIVSPRIFALLQEYPEKFSITDFYIEQCASKVISGYVPDNFRVMDIGKIDLLPEAEEFAKSLA